LLWVEQIRSRASLNQNAAMADARNSPKPFWRGGQDMVPGQSLQPNFTKMSPRFSILNPVAGNMWHRGSLV
jgi:hypothetical protein